MSNPGNPGAPFDSLLPGNAKWKAGIPPDFFDRSAEGQSPKTLWIGCSDSRVPETVITGGEPGNIFVQRNIANQFFLGDINVQSVLTYAVNHLHVKNVVVVGHSNCGGCVVALKASQIRPDAPADPSLPPDAPLNVWLAPLVRLAWSLGQVPGKPSVTLPVLVDANVRAQVKELKKSSIISKNKDIHVYGWVYDLGSGLLKDLGEVQED